MPDVVQPFARPLLVGAAAALMIMPATPQAQQGTNIWTAKSTSIDPRFLPLGDRKYSDSPKVGYIYPCEPRKYYSMKLGARLAGDWIHGSTWDATQKPIVQGEVFWKNATFTVTTIGDRRIFTGNGLPVDVPTGIFPIEKNDAAFRYDQNPDPIKVQNVSFSLPIAPTIAETPACIAPPVGIALDGVRFSSALDSLARDEMAYQMQDRCSGQSQPGGIYHRHALSDCIPHIHEHNTLVGYALDGFGIFSPYDADGRELTTGDLDECHGRTSEIMWDGKLVSMYHYVLTRDYPYTIGCFRGTATSLPMPPPPFFSTVRGFFARLWHRVLLVIPGSP